MLPQAGEIKSEGASNTRKAVFLPLLICLLAMIPAVRHTFTWLDNKILDIFSAVSPDLRFFTGRPELPEHPVVVVRKDQTFVERFGRDTNRRDFAELTRSLKNKNSQLLFFDFIFSEATDSEADQLLATAIASFPFPILAQHFVGRGQQTFEQLDITDKNFKRPPWPRPVFSDFEHSAATTALINIAADFDSTIRYLPLAFHPADMPEFMPTPGYAAWITSMIIEAESFMNLPPEPSAAGTELLLKTLSAAPFTFRSTGHTGLDTMTRRLEVKMLARLLENRYPQLRPLLSQFAGELPIASLTPATWLQMPQSPLPLIGRYEMPALRLPLNKLSPPLKGDGIKTVSMSTLLETDADRASAHMYHRYMCSFSNDENPLAFKVARPQTVAGNIKVSGRVINQFDQPVVDAEVLAFQPEADFFSLVKTAADGCYDLSDLHAGDCFIQVTRHLEQGFIQGKTRLQVVSSGSMAISDLLLPEASERISISVSDKFAADSEICIFGEPLAIIKSREGGETGLNRVPKDYHLIPLAEDSEAALVNGRLVDPDNQPAPPQLAALIADDSPWKKSFFFRHQAENNAGQVTIAALPPALDARLAVFSDAATSSIQSSLDIEILPGDDSAVAGLPAATARNNSLIEVASPFSAPDRTIIRLFKETGERYIIKPETSQKIPAGRYLVFSEDEQYFTKTATSWGARSEQMQVFSKEDSGRGMLKPGGLDYPWLFFGSALPQDQDFVVTPINFMDRNFPQLPGVHLHANLFSALKRNSFFRPVISHFDRNPVFWPIGQTLLILPILLLLNLVFVKFGAIWGVVCVLSSAGAWMLAAAGLFAHQTLLPAFFPMLQLMTFGFFRGYLSWSVARLQEQEARRTFARFISPAVVEDILRMPEGLKPGGEKKELSVIFTDLAGFTTISEKLEPEQLTELMNEYLDEMTRILFKFGGTLDKYIGDAIMGFWNHPKPQKDHAQRSVECAINMQLRLNQLREKWLEKGLPKVEVRAGINSAVCMVGFIGSHIQMNFTCLGDGVNLAARLEGANKAYGTYIMVTEAVYNQIDKNIISARFLDFLAVKGKEKPMKVYEIRGYRKDEPDTWLNEAEALYNSGTELYLQKKWDESIAAFNQVINILGEDGPSQVFIERCESFKDTPPPENWDGRYIMKTK